LKDAVKLGPRWPRQAPSLWYVSQRLDVEEGESELERMLARLLDLRHSYRP
jgi:tetraacyldisaccharide 4'-kinase